MESKSQLLMNLPGLIRFHDKLILFEHYIEYLSIIGHNSDILILQEVPNTPANFPRANIANVNDVGFSHSCFTPADVVMTRQSKRDARLDGMYDTAVYIEKPDEEMAQNGSEIYLATILRNDVV